MTTRESEDNNTKRVILHLKRQVCWPSNLSLVGLQTRQSSSVAPEWKHMALSGGLYSAYPSLRVPLRHGPAGAPL